MSQPPPPAPPPSSGDGGVPGAIVSADLGTRFLAKLIDFILLMIVNFIVVSTIIVGALFTAGLGRGGFMPFGGFSAAGIVSSVLSAAIVVGYFTFLESSRGQTIGKMLLKLEVRGPDGGRPSMEVAFKRNAWMLLSIIPFLGGLAQLVVAIIIAVTISNSATNTGWHDEFAGGTTVVKVG